MPTEQLMGRAHTSPLYQLCIF